MQPSNFGPNASGKRRARVAIGPVMSGHCGQVYNNYFLPIFRQTGIFLEN
jgi:hypothetical protein